VNLKSRIYVAGHKGMVGSALVNFLQSAGYKNIIVATREDLDLTQQAAVRIFFKENNIDQVYLAAAKVGGILANNDYPSDFIYQNLMIASNVIHEAFIAGVKKLLFIGSSCIYPRLAPQPISEDALLTGELEFTNEPYAIAKISGIKLCESYNRQYGESHSIDYRSVMPTNLYGPGDSYSDEGSHVIPALMARFHTAKELGKESVTVWGSGSPMREFLYVDDLARALVYVMNLPAEEYRRNTKPMLSHLNVGSGEEITIAELAELVADTVGFVGKIIYDRGRPDGTPRKLLNSNKIKNMGWVPGVDLKLGLSLVYQDFLGRGIDLA
jgi:GDP-L-fucose synthase